MDEALLWLPPLGHLEVVVLGSTAGTICSPTSQKAYPQSLWSPAVRRHPAGHTWQSSALILPYPSSQERGHTWPVLLDQHHTCNLVQSNNTISKSHELDVGWRMMDTHKGARTAVSHDFNASGFSIIISALWKRKWKVRERESFNWLSYCCCENKLDWCQNEMSPTCV